jgi:hypothetical protein
MENEAGGKRTKTLHRTDTQEKKGFATWQTFPGGVETGFNAACGKVSPGYL